MLEGVRKKTRGRSRHVPTAPTRIGGHSVLSWTRRHAGLVCTWAPKEMLSLGQGYQSGCPFSIIWAAVGHPSACIQP